MHTHAKSVEDTGIFSDKRATRVLFDDQQLSPSYLAPPCAQEGSPTAPGSLQPPAKRGKTRCLSKPGLFVRLKGMLTCSCICFLGGMAALSWLQLAYRLADLKVSYAVAMENEGRSDHVEIMCFSG